MLWSPVASTRHLQLMVAVLAVAEDRDSKLLAAVVVAVAAER